MIVSSILRFYQNSPEQSFCQQESFLWTKKKWKNDQLFLISMISYPDPEQGKQVDSQDYGVEWCGDWYVLCAPLKIIVN